MDHRTWISIRAKRENYFRGFILYSCDWSIFKQKLPPYSHKLSLNFITEALIMLSIQEATTTKTTRLHLQMGVYFINKHTESNVDPYYNVIFLD